MAFLGNFEISVSAMYTTLFAILFILVPSVIYYFESRPTQRPTTSSTLPKPPATEIISLRIYPIKSCRGFAVSSRKLLKTGFDLDRQWMFMDAKERKFLTIRQISKMTLINTALDEAKDELQISIAKTEHNPEVFISIPAHPSAQWLEQNTTLSACEIWGEQTDGYEYSASLTAPFSEFFGQEVRLMYKGPKPRVLRGNGAPDVFGSKESTMFADLAPVQVSNMRSMAELNGRLKKEQDMEITIERFRPNIIVKGDGAEPWSEDVWKTLRVSGSDVAGKGKDDLMIDVAARCARCQVPNVDPDTAEKNKKQPWDILMSYRRVDEEITYKPCFGMLCVPRQEGELKVGMKFEVTEVTNDHKYIKGM